MSIGFSITHASAAGSTDPRPPSHNHAPDGTALPCHAARSLPGLNLPNVQDMSLTDIWYESEAFNAFRGDEWMREPCQTCDERAAAVRARKQVCPRLTTIARKTFLPPRARAAAGRLPRFATL